MLKTIEELENTLFSVFKQNINNEKVIFVK